MDTMERDPVYIARQLRSLRKLHNLTQDNVAEAASLTRRTIEKLESGRHRPEEQTLRSIARALQVDIGVFEKPDPEEEARVQAEMEEATRKVAVLVTHPIRTASDFLSVFTSPDAVRLDMSAVTNDAALEIAGALGDWVRDLGDVWEDAYPSQRVEYAREFAKLCNELEGHGYLCYMGRHRQQQRLKGRAPMVFTVGTMSLQPRDGTDGPRYALVPLEEGWETMPGDGPS